VSNHDGRHDFDKFYGAVQSVGRLTTPARGNFGGPQSAPAENVLSRQTTAEQAIRTFCSAVVNSPQSVCLVVHHGGSRTSIDRVGSHGASRWRRRYPGPFRLSRITAPAASLVCVGADEGIGGPGTD
jgi:hypothetical protein